MSDQVFFEDVSVGDAIPTNTEVVSEVQMFFFSAATNNGHRIHYDKPYATGVEGHPDILVHGPLQAGLMAKTLTDWIGPSGRLVRIQLQNRANAFPGEELRFTGRITAKREDERGGAARGLVDLEIGEEKGESQIIMPGTATVSLPRRLAS